MEGRKAKIKTNKKDKEEDEKKIFTEFLCNKHCVHTGYEASELQLFCKIQIYIKSRILVCICSLKIKKKKRQRWPKTDNKQTLPVLNI